jgi:tetratricopeptide (TPR) repeat protein
MRLFCLLAIAWLALACAESARDQLADARQALAESKYAEAIAAADRGLEAEGDEVTAWGLELVRLEALARDGRGDETLALIERLTEQRPEQMSASQYSTSAEQLRAADQRVAAIQVLDRGLQRFPGDATLVALIEEAKQTPDAGSGELDMLRSLGYVE